MLTAQNRQAISANTTESGSEPPAKMTPAGIDAAIAAPGAMSVMLWNVTSRRPMAFRRRPVSVVVAVSVAIDASPGRSRVVARMVSRVTWVTPGHTLPIFPGWLRRIHHAGAGRAATIGLMQPDRPDGPETAEVTESAEPVAGARPLRRGALDDLRERLARLPPGHPSSAGYGSRSGEPEGPGWPAEAGGPGEAEEPWAADRPGADRPGAEGPGGADEPREAGEPWAGDEPGEADGLAG